MRCSSSEARLDAFVDGVLPPLEQTRVAAHVDGCSECAALLQELRVIDALLLTPRVVVPAPNFTFKVMAEARSLPAPHARHALTASVIAAYLGFAWVAIALFFVLAGSSARSAVAALTQGGLRAGDSLVALGGAASHLFGRYQLGVTAAVGGILTLDLVVAAAAVLIYTVVRPRLAASIARSTEVC